MKTKVFISWSGKYAMDVANALRDWIPDVIQSVETWASDQDISVGDRWQAVIASELDNTNLGILCLTKENMEKPWLMFEAGALSKSLSSSRVMPVLIGMERADIYNGHPLSSLNNVFLNEAGIMEVLLAINAELPSSSQLTNERLERIFKSMWEELEKKLDAAHNAEEDRQSKVKAISTQTQRPQREILDDILGGVREIIRNQKALERTQEGGAKVDTPATGVSLSGNGLKAPLFNLHSILIDGAYRTIFMTAGFVTMYGSQGIQNSYEMPSSGKYKERIHTLLTFINSDTVMLEFDAGDGFVLSLQRLHDRWVVV